MTKVTGPYMLQRVVAELLLESPRVPQFGDAGGLFYVRGTNRSVRVLPGKYTCSGKSPYCGDVNSFGGNVLFKYKGYDQDEKAMGVKRYTHTM